MKVHASGAEGGGGGGNPKMYYSASKWALKRKANPFYLTCLLYVNQETGFPELHFEPEGCRAVGLK